MDNLGRDGKVKEFREKFIQGVHLKFLGPESWEREVRRPGKRDEITLRSRQQAGNVRLLDSSSYLGSI